MTNAYRPSSEIGNGMTGAAKHVECAASSRRRKSYAAYKDSGVEWLGKIPVHWEVRRLRSTVTSCQNGVWGDEPGGVNDVVCVRVADFNRVTFRVEIEEPTMRAIDTAVVVARGLRPGDLLLEKSGGGENQPVGAVVLFDQEVPAVCSNFVARVSVASGHDPRYQTYLHATLYAQRINTRHIKQSTGIQNLDSSSYLGESVGLPTKAEQRTIANFLDRETVQIDVLIKKKERLIELLKEQRAALITRAVTKGLDPNVPMKNSGVERLGEIPAHWVDGTLRRFWTVVDCKHRTAAYVSEGIPLVSTTEVKPGKLKLDGPRRVTEADFNDLTRDGRRPRRGDVIYSRNASLGSAAYIDTDDLFCMGQDVCLITSHADQLYLAYQLNSRIVLSQIDEVSVGSTFDRINVAQIKNFHVARPPEEEQTAIAAFLDRETTRIDALVSKVRDAIARLKELRAALISAAVTGKIDVREEIA